jgi:hypothetical protein
VPLGLPPVPLGLPPVPLGLPPVPLGLPPVPVTVEPPVPGLPLGPLDVQPKRATAIATDALVNFMFIFAS